MSAEPIVVDDNGTGMTEEELRRHYLPIAADRRARSGEFTALKRRRVKGRKGIGKFAGLMAAAEMNLESAARGKRCSFILNIEALATVDDIEKLDLPLQVDECASDEHGTRITLRRLHQGLSFPDPDCWRACLRFAHVRIPPRRKTVPRPARRPRLDGHRPGPRVHPL